MAGEPLIAKRYMHTSWPGNTRKPGRFSGKLPDLPEDLSLVLARLPESGAGHDAGDPEKCRYDTGYSSHTDVTATSSQKRPPSVYVGPASKNQRGTSQSDWL